MVSSVLWAAGSGWWLVRLVFPPFWFWGCCGFRGSLLGCGFLAVVCCGGGLLLHSAHALPTWGQLMDKVMMKCFCSCQFRQAGQQIMRKLCQCRPVSENNHYLQSNTHPSGTSGSKPLEISCTDWILGHGHHSISNIFPCMFPLSQPPGTVCCYRRPIHMPWKPNSLSFEKKRRLPLHMQFAYVCVCPLYSVAIRDLVVKGGCPPSWSLPKYPKASSAHHFFRGGLAMLHPIMGVLHFVLWQTSLRLLEESMCIVATTTTRNAGAFDLFNLFMAMHKHAKTTLMYRIKSTTNRIE